MRYVHYANHRLSSSSILLRPHLAMYGYIEIYVYRYILALGALGSFSGWQHSIFRNFANLSMDVASVAFLYFVSATSA